MSVKKQKLAAAEEKALLQNLKTRFEKNMHRHKKLSWDQVEAALAGHPEKLRTLNQMENSGGEPDVVVLDAKQKDAIVFADCSPESPAGRRSLCYDERSLHERKENKPAGSALGMAEEMGAELLTEAQYRALQQFGPFDAKTSSWVHTPDDIRSKGGALFCDYRYGTVFVYHNGASSYYAARGFRVCLHIS